MPPQAHIYVDPEEKLIRIMMMRVPLSAAAACRHAVRHLAYRALVSPE
jgi:hypothetical protein